LEIFNNNSTTRRELVQEFCTFPAPHSRTHAHCALTKPERETDNEESFFGVSKLAYPMPTRHESEDSLPEGGVVQAVADVDNFLIQAVQEAEASAAVQVKIIEVRQHPHLAVPR